MRRSIGFSSGDQVTRHRRAQLQLPLALVEVNGHIEGVEKLDQLGVVGLIESLAEVRYLGQQGFDLLSGRPCFLTRLCKPFKGSLDGLGAPAQLFDPLGRELDHRVVGIVVLLQAKHLAAQRLLNLFLLALQALALREGGVLLLIGGCYQLGAQQTQAVGTEKAFCQKLAERVHDNLLANAQGPRVSR